MSGGLGQVSAILGLLGLLLTEASCGNKIKVKTVTSEKSGSGQQPVLTYEAGAKIEMSDAESTAHPLLVIESSRVCSDITFYNGDGELVQGSRDCSSASGDPNLKPEYIKEGVTIGGVTGTLSNCSSNGEIGCVTTATYQSADLTNLSAGNIKRGVAIAGTTGNFPSATSPLPRYSDSGATTNTAGIDETDLTNFATQLTSAGTFEYWDSSGIRWTGSGDADITAANVKNAVAFENLSVTGTYTGAANCTGDGQTGCTTTSTYKSVDTSALTVWDIRMGKSAGGIAGSLTFFKNMANTTLFNRTAGTSAAAGLDYYDTIDDYNANGAFPTQNNTGWDQATGANWTAVVANTTYRDEITGLVWLKDDAATYTWENAITKCENSTAGSRSDWRLPTQKELMQAYTDGIWSQKTGLSLATNLYWAASTYSANTALAWVVYLWYGGILNTTKTNAGNVVCVAP